MTARGDVEAIIGEQCNDDGPKRDIGPDGTTQAASKGIDLQQPRRYVQHDAGGDDDAERLRVCNSSGSPGQRGHAELHRSQQIAQQVRVRLDLDADRAWDGARPYDEHGARRERDDGVD